MQTGTGLTDLQIRNRQNHYEEIFPCKGRCFVSALRIVGVRSVAVRQCSARARNPREWLRHSRNEFTDGKLAKARRREFATQTREVSAANGERPYTAKESDTTFA